MFKKYLLYVIVFYVGCTRAEAAALPPITPTLNVDKLSFDQILAALKQNDPNLYSINLSRQKLSIQQLQELQEIIDNNTIVGSVQWEKDFSISQSIKTHIEKRLIRNICSYVYHPSDYIHGLFANHIYKNPTQNILVNLNTLSKEFDHQLSANIPVIWKVVQVRDDSKHTGYYSALYINETTHQAILAFQGTKLEGLRSLVSKQSDLQEDIDSILGNAITTQNALAYEATQEAVNYVREKGFHLSTTGHSLGGYLAELAVAFCYRDFNYRNIKGIVFDSPGTVNKLDHFKSNIIHKSTYFSIDDLPIITYLSAPNLVNACNRHPGEVYRIYPKLEWSARIKKWIQVAGNIPLIGTDIKNTNKAILALTGHSLDGMLRLFDPTTGKPKECIRVLDWPRLDTDKLAYVGKKKQELEKMSILKTGAAVLMGKTGLMHGAFQILPQLIGGTAASIVAVLKDYLNIDQAQYWATLAYLDEGYKEVVLSAQQTFAMHYKAHYRISDKKPNEHILYTQNYESIDWYLHKLYKQKSKLQQYPTNSLTVAVLKNIVQDYEIVSLDECPYIRLTATQKYVERLRDKMRRALEVLTASGINQALENSNIYVLTKQLEKSSITHLTQLYNYIPQARLKNYVSRPNEQQQLIQKLKKEGICVVYGHGGVGKSTLVAEYGHRQKDKQAVWWVSAETIEKILANYEKLAQELNINYQVLAQEFSQESIQYLTALSRKVYDALVKREKSVLLILDHAIDAIAVDACLLHRPSLVEIVITTRDKKSFINYNQIEVKDFTVQEAKKYIQQSLNPYTPSETEIQQLVSEVGLIPHKLSLATSYIHQISFMNIEKYVCKLQNIKQEGKKEIGNLVLPEANLGLENLDATAQLLLQYGAYLDSDFIPLSLINGLLNISEEEELHVILNELEKLSLITIINSPIKTGIQIHQEIQTTCRNYKGWKDSNNLPTEKILNTLIEVLLQDMPKVSSIPDSAWKQASLYALSTMYVIHASINQQLPIQSHLANLVERMADYHALITNNYAEALRYYEQALVMQQNLDKKNNPSISNLLDCIGMIYCRLGKYREALNKYQEVLAINQSLYKNDNAIIAHSLHHLGKCYYRLGKYKEALKCYEKALKIRRALGPNHEAYIEMSLNVISEVYQALGNPQEARKYCQQSLDMCKSFYTGNHPYTAKALNNMGGVCKTLGKFEEALKYYQQGLHMFQDLYTGNHPYVVESLSNMGSIYNTIGNFQEALKYYEQSLKMCQSLYTDTHPYLADALNNMGKVYQKIGNYKQALINYQKALHISQEVYIDNHPGIASSLNNMGKIYYELANYKEALQYYQKALKMYQMVYTEPHPHIAYVLNNIGKIYQDTGSYKEASTYYQQALAIRTNMYTGNHPHLANSLNAMGNTYQYLGNFKEALKYYEQALKMQQALYTDSHPKLVISLNNIGTIHQVLSNFKEALQYYEQALAMSHKLYVGNHSSIAMSLHSIGDTYQAIGKFKEALQYYQQAFTIRQELYDNNHPVIASSLYNLGRLHYKQGEYIEALKYYEQALAMNQQIYTSPHPYIAISLNAIGNIYQNTGKLQEALRYYEQALDMTKVLYLDKHPHIAASLYNMGSIYYDLADFKQAFQYQKQSLEMHQLFYPDNNQYVARGLSSMGDIYLALGNLQEALKYYEQTLKMNQALYTGNHTSIAKTWKDIGDIYQLLENTIQAISCYEKALLIARAIHTDNLSDKIKILLESLEQKISAIKIANSNK